MPTFFERWTHAKGDVDKVKALFGPAELTRLNKGAPFGAALKTFDKAGGYEGRHKAMLAVRAAKEAYDKELRAVLKTIVDAKKKDSPAYKAVDKLEKNVLAILVDADKEAQPPKPGGGTVPYEVIRNFNLAGGFKPKFLDIGVTKVDVIIEVDKTLDALIKANEESLKIDHLGEVAKQELAKLGDAFGKTMAAVDGKIEDLDGKGRADKIREANETLKYYSGIVESRLAAVVEKEWQAYLSRKQYLKEFRIKCTVKIVLGTVGVAVAITSAVLSFGALWMNVVAAVKGVADITQTIKTWAEELDPLYAKLVKDIEAIHALNQQRETAKKKGEGQKASKGASVAKEIATAILPITKNMIRSASSVEDRAKQMLGLVSKLETKADELVGQLNNKYTPAISALPHDLPPAMKPDADKLKENFKKLTVDISDLHRRSQACAKFGERALLEVKKLRVEDLWTGSAASEFTGAGTKGVAVYALANFALEAAKHGTTLLSLL